MNLAHTFTETVTVASQTGSDVYDKPAFGAQRAIKAAVRMVRRRAASASGVEVVNVSVLVTDQPIAQGDRIWLPGSDTSKPEQSRRLGVVRTQPTLNGRYRLYEVDL